MFSSTKSKILIGVFVLVVLAIPASTFLLSQRLGSSSSQGLNPNTTITQPAVSSSPLSGSPLDILRKNLTETASPSPTPNQDDGSLVPSGPTLSFKIAIEGRPVNDQHTTLFVGIAEGGIQNSPNYLLSFNVSIPSSGEYSDVSLTGLTQGQTYTAYLKGLSTLVKGVSFVMNPTGVTINNDQPINLTTGDLNQDNIIDQNDYDLEKSALGATPSSARWNPNMDFNLDNTINNVDLSIISKNLNQIGDSGKWYSPTPVATSSAKLITPPSIGGAGGHWLWVPDIN